MIQTSCSAYSENERELWLSKTKETEVSKNMVKQTQMNEFLSKNFIGLLKDFY